MKTLFDKIWDAHVVSTVEDGPTQLYIDRLYCHERRKKGRRKEREERKIKRKRKKEKKRKK